MNEDSIPAAASAASGCQRNPPYRILVVDDDKDIRRLNREVLMDCGYEVVAAEDGAVAWDALHADNYDLLITDSKMPTVTGIDLIKKIRGKGMTLPVILTSGKMPTEELHCHSWLKVQALLHKPYTLSEFLKTVKDVLCAKAVTSGQMVLTAGWQEQPGSRGLRQG